MGTLPVFKPSQSVPPTLTVTESGEDNKRMKSIGEEPLDPLSSSFMS